jgi:hypothetical protein
MAGFGSPKVDDKFVQPAKRPTSKKTLATAKVREWFFILPPLRLSSAVF